MDYKVVRRSHVVTRGYLRSFAVGEIIAQHVVADSTMREVPISNAGVLRDFYLRHRPDGTPIRHRVVARAHRQGRAADSAGDLAALAAWPTLPDDEAPIVKGTKETAANFNAFTIAEAEHVWFHMPGEAVPRASGQLLPVAPRLLRHYSAELALESHRRNETNRRIQPKIGKGTLDAGFEILRIWPDGQAEIVRAEPPNTA